MKKRLIADQIRHRMQTKNSGNSATGSSSPTPSGRKRRGRPPKISQEDYMSPHELGVSAFSSHLGEFSIFG
jgi:hypothetical protein